MQTDPAKKHTSWGNWDTRAPLIRWLLVKSHSLLPNKIQLKSGDQINLRPIDHPPTASESQQNTRCNKNRILVKWTRSNEALALPPAYDICFVLFCYLFNNIRLWPISYRNHLLSLPLCLFYFLFFKKIILKAHLCCHLSLSTRLCLPPSPLYSLI